MTGLVRKATLLSVCGLLAASAALANVPDPAQSIVPTGIRLVGQSAGTPSPVGLFQVTVKDLAGNLIANSNVVIDFSGMPDLKIADPQLDGSTPDCVLKTVRISTDGSGVATFTVLGGGVGTASVLASDPPTVTVYADGVLLATIPGAAYDLNGGGGVAAADLSLWLAFAAPPAKMVADLDFSTTVGAADLSLWLSGAASQPTSGVPCP